MNKLCLVMFQGFIELGVVILPSRRLYQHLTDRIGNWEELSPYAHLWHHFGGSIARGLLAVVVVEQDEDTDNPSVPFMDSSFAFRRLYLEWRTGGMSSQTSARLTPRGFILFL